MSAHPFLRSLPSGALALLLLAAAAPAQAQSFGAMDVDRDGALSYPEARRWMPELNEVIFLKADADGDGLIEPRDMPSLQALYRQVYLDR